jgi:hypothetical protein
VLQVWPAVHTAELPSWFLQSVSPAAPGQQPPAVHAPAQHTSAPFAVQTVLSPPAQAPETQAPMLVPAVVQMNVGP